MSPLPEGKPELPGDEAGWRRAKDIFSALSEATPDERARVLAEMKPSDPVRTAVERLLRSLDNATGFMEEPEGSRSGPGVLDFADAPMPSRIGPYTPLERLGEGGFGIVYRARQSHPVDREVAIKVLRSGLESPQVLARFGEERRFLSRLDHPDVVRILDAGATDDGRLYVVMDFVPGAPITTFVRDRGLGIEECLRLFARVCRAVHAVHQRAVIHRDLKPSNIVVSQEAEGPRPRIIDFGIATALDATDRSGWTRVGAPIGTPKYASPEQSASSGAVDTRTDVYALGVILCEMLTARVPRSHASGAETAPLLPSKAAALADDPALSRALRGDLDRIVLKATAWEASHRYDSAASLADDIDRRLAGLPVLAAAPGRVYTARKFVRRHRTATAAAALAVLALVVGLAVSLVATGEANRQRRIAESNARRAAFIGSFLLNTIERNADPDARGREVVLDESALDALTREAIDGLDEDPVAMLDLLETIGLIRYKLGHLDAAADCFARAHDHALEMRGGPSDRSVRLRMLLAQTLEADHANRSAAQELMLAAERDARTLFDEHDPRLISIRIRLPIGIDDLERLVLLLEADPSARPDDVIAGLGRLYWRLELGKTPSRALPYAKRCFEAAQRYYGSTHSVTVNAMIAYASAESVHGSPHAAIPLLTEALERSLSTFGPDHRDTESARRALARVYGEAGRPREGIPIAIEHERSTRSLHGEGSVQHAGALRVIGTLYAQAGDLEPARDTLRAGLDSMRRHWPPTHTMVTGGEARLASVLADLGEFDEADEIATRALKSMQPGAMAIPIAMAASAKARALRARGEPDAATALLAETLAKFEAAGVEGHPVEMLEALMVR